MKYIIYPIFFTLLLCSSITSFAQFPQWADTKLFAGNWYDRGHDIYIDKHDNYYIAGEYQDGADPAFPGNFQVDCEDLVPFRNSQINAFVLRYDAARNLTLQLTLPGRPAEVKTDTAGDIYVVGQVEYDYSFGGINIINNGGQADGFIAKYTPGGSLLWYRIVKSDQADVISSIDIDKSGNIAISGFSNGTEVYMLERWQTGPFSFIASLTPDGDVNWVTTDLDNRSSKIRFDASGNLVLAGSTSVGGSIRGWLAKANGATGKIIWKVTVGEDNHSNYIQNATAVAIAADGSYLFGGEFSGEGRLGSQVIKASGYLDVFLLQTDTAGNINWVTTGGSTEFDKLYSIYESRSGDIYFTGGYSDGFVIGNTTLHSKGYTDVYAGALDKNGTLKWILTGGSDITGHKDEFFYHEYGAAIAEDAKGKVHIVGTTVGSGSFGHLVYRASESTHSNVFWSVIGDTGDYYTVSYPCNSQSADKTVIVYPNPFTSSINIQLYGSFATGGETTVRLFDMLGRLLKVERWSGNIHHITAWQNLTSGVYLAEIENSAGRKIVKVIKQR